MFLIIRLLCAYYRKPKNKNLHTIKSGSPPFCPPFFFFSFFFLSAPIASGSSCSRDWIWATAVNYAAAAAIPDRLTHCARPGIEPALPHCQARSLTHCITERTPVHPFLTTWSKTFQVIFGGSRVVFECFFTCMCLNTIFFFWMYKCYSITYFLFSIKNFWKISTSMYRST